MSRYWEHNVPYLALMPFCITYHPHINDTDIPYDKGGSNRTLAIRIRREWFKFLDNLHKKIFDIMKRGI
ncbi:hypothetical protein [Basilea psittacipulmonis]|uniref:hypothetical protein n=1 Tax=Basilea psittacipulmonis TaxID=1472345 RepID=UPI001178B572|nr:hypothetical protein [Basilea psittacipulmonis]